LSALSGYQYVHHLFTATVEIISYRSMATAQQVQSNRSLMTATESRVSLLEHQFDAFRGQKDLEFAVQSELNCWQENRTNETFFVITGLPSPPSQMSGG
jgi:hypothetical protein